MDRVIRIMTGAGGYDLISEAFENEVGLYRVYIKKVPRFLRTRRKFLKSASGRWYRKFWKPESKILYNTIDKEFENKFGKLR